MRILLNEVECNKCGDVIVSKHRHDYVTCKCEAVSVDGGMEYLRRIGHPSHFTERSIMMDNDHVMCLLEAAEWCRETSRNSLGYVCAFLRTMRDLGYLSLPGNDNEEEIEKIIERRFDDLDLQLMNGVIDQDEYEDLTKDIDGWAREVWRNRRWNQ